jgi:hypothetical protein
MKDAIVEFKVFTRTSGREVLDAMKREQRGLEQQELEQQAEVSRLVLPSLVLELALLLVLARLALLLLLVLVLAWPAPLRRGERRSTRRSSRRR